MFLYNAVSFFVSTDSSDVSWETECELSVFENDIDLCDFGAVKAVSSSAV